MAIPTAPQPTEMMPLEDLEKLLLQFTPEGGPAATPAGMGPPPEAMAETLPADPSLMGMDPMMQEAGMEPMPEESMAVDPFMDTGASLDMISPDMITIATTALVEAGFLDLASSELTPELVQTFQQVADQMAPGVYNMNNDADLMEFVNGIANGTIPVPSAKSLTSGGESAGPPAGEPPAGALPGEPAGGLPGVPAGDPGY